MVGGADTQTDLVSFLSVAPPGQPDAMSGVIYVRPLRCRRRIAVIDALKPPSCCSPRGGSDTNKTFRLPDGVAVQVPDKHSIDQVIMT